MTTARRTPSTTSLSKYVRDGLPEADEEEIDHRSSDFCNAFWGIAYGGYEVLLTRLRGATRTTEELKAFWKERAAIEDDYAKKLGKLAKQSLGRDEIGDLRLTLDLLRIETEKQAQAHNTLAMTMRKELEQPIAELLNKQTYFKKTAQVAIEKSFRAMQTQESYVKKARQKYEEDCIKINSFTAQATLIQGKELEKIQLKLDKTKQTVQANEREYSQFSRALADTTSRWEKEWKVFCDAAQDLEEERIEFMKDNMWGYANAISTVCVSDDESCEKLRVALEQVEAEKDVENFVHDYTTGSQIPDPPAFVDFNSPSARQQQHPTWRIANFVRSSTRPVYPIQDAGPDDVPASPGRAGIGAVEGGIVAGSGDKFEPNLNPSRPSSAAAVHASLTGTPAPSNNGVASVTSALPASSGMGIKQQTAVTPGMRVVNSPIAINASTTSLPQTNTVGTALAGAFRNRTNTLDTNPAGLTGPNTELKVGPNVYPVNPNDDPQRNRTQANSTTLPNTNVGAQDDPIAQQLDMLRSSATRKDTASSITGISATAAPEPKTSPLTSVNKASVFSASGPQSGVASVSPNNPPMAAMMKSPASRSSSPLPVEKIVENYSPRLPGELRSRDLNRENSLNPNSPENNWSSRRETSPTREIRPGIGAYGGSRSPSPQQQSGGYSSARSPRQQQAPIRNQTPLGIAIDESGQVAQDALLDRMRLQQPNYAQPQTSKGYTQAPQQPSGRYDSRYPEYSSPNNYGAPQNAGFNVPPPPSLSTYAVDPRLAQGYFNQQGYPSSGQGSVDDYNNTYQNYGHGAIARTPSPPAPPTNQYTEDGKPVLFYVKALYDYQATIDEEFDFQAGDIIAVTATPEDGWWSGELLDEMRRVHGKTIFPSNFVALF